MTKPAGAATDMALPNTNNVLSKIDLITIFPICGFLYGGNSNTKEDGIPFKIVLDNILEMNNVRKIPNKITNNTANVDSILAPMPCMVPAIKILAIVMRNGNLPITWYKVVG